MRPLSAGGDEVYVVTGRAPSLCFGATSRGSRRPLRLHGSLLMVPLHTGSPLQGGLPPLLSDASTTLQIELARGLSPPMPVSFELASQS